MILPKYPLLLLLQFLSELPIAVSASSDKKSPAANAILLSKVQSLTLRGDGALTTGRRSSPVHQLQCDDSTTPGICNLYSVDVMRCTNMGSSYGPEDIEWSCTASLPPELRLASTEVGCEGYRNADDEFVLRGSCGVVYKMVLTEEGREKFPELTEAGAGSREKKVGGDTKTTIPGRRKKTSEMIFDGLFWLFFGGIFILVFGALFAAILRGSTNVGNGGGDRRRGGTRYGGGGGGGGWDDPPPPYDDGGGGFYSDNADRGSRYKSSSRNSGWKPGFYSGLAAGSAAGGAAGYAAGSRNNRNSSSRSSPPRYTSSSSSSSSGRTGGSSSSGSGISSTRHTSTGFGSTSRR